MLYNVVVLSLSRFRRIQPLGSTKPQPHPLGSTDRSSERPLFAALSLPLPNVGDLGWGETVHGTGDIPVWAPGVVTRS